MLVMLVNNSPANLPSCSLCRCYSLLLKWHTSVINRHVFLSFCKLYNFLDSSVKYCIRVDNSPPNLLSCYLCRCCSLLLLNCPNTFATTLQNTTLQNTSYSARHTAHCLLHTPHLPPLCRHTAHYSARHSAHCLLHTTHLPPLCKTHCTMLTAHRTLHTITNLQNTLYAAHCTCTNATTLRNTLLTPY